MAKKTAPKIKSNETILGPRITEKASILAERNVYVFDVAKTANKLQIKNAVKALYKVMPLSVNTVVEKPKKIVQRGKVGTRGGGKKAYVELKKGDKIELA